MYFNVITWAFRLIALTSVLPFLFVLVVTSEITLDQGYADTASTIFYAVISHEL